MYCTLFCKKRAISVSRAVSFEDFSFGVWFLSRFIWICLQSAIQEDWRVTCCKVGGSFDWSEYHFLQWMMGTILNNKSSEGTIRVDNYCKTNVFSARVFVGLWFPKGLIHLVGICSSIFCAEIYWAPLEGDFGFSSTSAAVTYGRFPSSSRWLMVNQPLESSLLGKANFKRP